MSAYVAQPPSLRILVRLLKYVVAHLLVSPSNLLTLVQYFPWTGAFMCQDPPPSVEAVGIRYHWLAV